MFKARYVALATLAAGFILAVTGCGASSPKPADYAASFSVANGQPSSQYGLTVDLESDSSSIGVQTTGTLTLTPTAPVTIKVVLNLNGTHLDSYGVEQTENYDVTYGTFPVSATVTDTVHIQSYGLTAATGYKPNYGGTAYNALLGITIYILKPSQQS